MNKRDVAAMQLALLQHLLAPDENPVPRSFNEQDLARCADMMRRKTLWLADKRRRRTISKAKP